MRKLLINFAVIGVLCTLTFAATPTSTIAVTGQAAPGANGARFSSFGAPSINRKGDVAFRAGLSGGSAISGIFVASGGQIMNIALSKDQEGKGTAAYFDFGDPVINDSGDIAFFGRTGNGMHVNDGAVVLRRGANLMEIARNGQPAPGTTGNFEELAQYGLALNNSGTVVFHARVSGTGSAEGIFSTSGNGVVPVVLSTDVRFGHFSGLALNDAGKVAFVAFVRGAVPSTGAFVADRDEVRTVAVEGQIASDGTQLGVLSSPSINDQGDIAFIDNEVNHGRFTSIDPKGVFVARGSEIRTISKKAQTARLLSGYFHHPIIVTPSAGNEAVIFRAADTAGGSAVMLKTSAGLRPLVRDGDQAGSGSTYAVIASASFAPSGQFAFVSRLNDKFGDVGLFSGTIALQ
jgi:hypothetical protein